MVRSVVRIQRGAIAPARSQDRLGPSSTMRGRPTQRASVAGRADPPRRVRPFSSGGAVALAVPSTRPSGGDVRPPSAWNRRPRHAEPRASCPADGRCIPTWTSPALEVPPPRGLARTRSSAVRVRGHDLDEPTAPVARPIARTTHSGEVDGSRPRRTSRTASAGHGLRPSSRIEVGVAGRAVRRPPAAGALRALAATAIPSHASTLTRDSCARAAVGALGGRWPRASARKRDLGASSTSARPR